MSTEQNTAVSKANAAKADQSKATLKIEGPDMHGKVFYLTGEEVVSIGRGSANGLLLLDDPNVSRKHAEILSKGEKFFIKDNKSLNRTHVNGKEVHFSSLKHGDVIKIGDFKLVYEKAESPQA